MSGENNPMFGKRHTQDTLDKMSAALTGDNHSMFGKKHSAETIAKRIATRARNKEAKEILALLSQSEFMNVVQS